MVVPDGLAARIDAARGVGQSRGDWLRRAAERALEVSSPETSGIERVAPVTPAPAELLDSEDVLNDEFAEDVRADEDALRARGVCPWHPDAGRTRSRGWWWCAEPGCSVRFERVPR